MYGVSGRLDKFSSFSPSFSSSFFFLFVVVFARQSKNSKGERKNEKQRLGASQGLDESEPWGFSSWIHLLGRVTYETQGPFRADCPFCHDIQTFFSLGPVAVTADTAGLSCT